MKYQQRVRLMQLIEDGYYTPEASEEERESLKSIIELAYNIFGEVDE